MENAVVPFFLTSIYEGERPALPMIDVTLTKENALPHDLWGLIYQDWKPTPEEGVTVFLQGLEKRGDNNLRKRIYMSAVTPDLYRPMYGAKVVAFFDGLLDPKFAGKPFMRHYLDYYWDIYWDLHLGVKGDAIPPQVRTIGESFNTVLAFRDPTQPIVYDNYMTVRALLDFLKNWIDERLDDIANARIANPGENVRLVLAEECRRRRAFQQEGRRLRVLPQLRRVQPMGQHDLRDHVAPQPGWRRSRTSAPRSRRRCRGLRMHASGAPYTPLEMFVMELFRTISPNGGSISAMSTDAQASRQLRRQCRPLCASACPTSATATSSRRTPRPASIPGTGPIRSNSTRSLP